MFHAILLLYTSLSTIALALWKTQYVVVIVTTADVHNSYNDF
jgi:hypothetical protein